MDPKRIGAMLVLAFLSLVIVVLPAFALDSPKEWSDGPAVGRCGTVAEPHVRMVQAILWATGDLRSLGDVDGTWDRRTFLAVKSHQRIRGLPMSGCVTAGTWDDMQYGTDPFGLRPHLRRVAGCETPGVSACDAWVFTEIDLGFFDAFDRIRYDRRVRFEWVDPGCWVLVKLKNLHNGRMLILNEYIFGNGSLCVSGLHS